jgi:DNA-binding CsgD family transcriptional regulator
VSPAGRARSRTPEPFIADQTARNHIERIHGKLGVSTCAETSLYAMRQGLID